MTRLTFLEKQVLRKPPCSTRGICRALARASHMGAEHLPAAFRAFLRREELNDGFPIQGLMGQAESYGAYEDSCGQWSPDTQAGLLRLTVWGAFWHWYETEGKSRTAIGVTCPDD